MRPGHGKNVGRAVDQAGREGLTSLLTDIDPFLFANLNGVETWRLSSDGMDTCGCHLDVFPIADEATKQALGNGTATDVSGTDKQDAFHNGRRASYANQPKV
jgi:hypothetical protein